MDYKDLIIFGAYRTTKFKSKEEKLTHFIVSVAHFLLTLDLAILAHRRDRHQQCKGKHNLQFN